MTAEEELKELYDQQKPGVILDREVGNIHITRSGSVFVAAEHIDLIANLVVERMGGAIRRLELAHDVILGEGVKFKENIQG